MKWRKEDGQATVEFALVLPILLLLIFGMIDFGWMFFNKIQVNNASREGARYAVVHYTETEYQNNTVNRVTDVLPDSNVTISVNGDDITVTVTKEVDVLTGITSTFTGDTVDLSSSCTMKKE